MDSELQYWLNELNSLTDGSRLMTEAEAKPYIEDALERVEYLLATKRKARRNTRTMRRAA